MSAIEHTTGGDSKRTQQQGRSILFNSTSLYGMALELDTNLRQLPLPQQTQQNGRRVRAPTTNQQQYGVVEHQRVIAQLTNNTLSLGNYLA